MQPASQKFVAALQPGFVFLLLWVSHTSIVMAQSPDTSFTTTGNMTTPRQWHTATLLPDGTVLITGSRTWVGGVPGAELSDPDAGAFRAVGGTIPSDRFGRPRTTATLTLLTNGKVLAMLEDAEAGDSDGAAVYDIAAGAFTATGETTV